jgi:hypothetical protein
MMVVLLIVDGNALGNGQLNNGLNGMALGNNNGVGRRHPAQKPGVAKPAVARLQGVVKAGAPAGPRHAVVKLGGHKPAAQHHAAARGAARQAHVQVGASKPGRPAATHHHGTGGGSHTRAPAKGGHRR